MKPYKPKPVDTSDIKLPDDILKLSEKLAENIHENWAAERIKKGWKPGKERNDKIKTHPCLVPYKALPDSEKEYDRKTMHESLKTLLKLGYRIEAPADKKAGTDPAMEQILEVLNSKNKATIKQLLSLWRSRDKTIRLLSQESHYLLADRFIRSGENLLAYDVVEDGLNIWENEPVLMWLKARTLIRSGVPDEAFKILTELNTKKNLLSLENKIKTFKRNIHVREEILGNIGRIYKDRWQNEKNRIKREQYLKDSYESYNNAFKHPNHTYWSGINASALSLIAGNRAQAFKLAEKVINECGQELNSGTPYPYYAEETLGQACFIMSYKDSSYLDKAVIQYKKAVSLAKNEFGELNSSLKNLKLIMDNVETESVVKEEITGLFNIPNVAVFVGHMIDKPGRKEKRFPKEITDKVKNRIKEELKKHNIKIGFASAACGSDILFHEAVRSLGGESHIILPYDEKSYCEDRVEITDDKKWAVKFRNILKNANELTKVTDRKIESDSISNDYANSVLYGLAKNKAKSLGTELIHIAVWDGSPSHGRTGTSTIAEEWRKKRKNIVVINPKEMFTYKNKITAKQKNKIRAQKSSMEIKAILFADVVKFSRLVDSQIRIFVERFLKSIADLINKVPYKPVVKNTWGDGLYFVFNSVSEAGLFGLDLCSTVTGKDWYKEGLNKETNIRIALHAGPVYSCTDPVTGADTYNGTHVSRAARIEPITPPGQVYASEQFAALVSYNNIDEIICNYAGRIPLAKSYGTFPIYHVRRK